MNKAGQMITVMSTCKPDKTWSQPTAFPYGALSIPPKLTKPDGPGMLCGALAGSGCKSLNLTYNPNTEVGTDFHCKTPLDWENLPVKVEPTNNCILMCAEILMAVVGCKNGLWTGNPDLGFWCHHEMEEVGHWVGSGTGENGMIWLNLFYPCHKKKKKNNELGLSWAKLKLS